jgi:hypothetical protein
MTGIDWLRTLHTKQLLAIKNDCYGHFMKYGKVSYNDSPDFTREDLKQVLSERDHIPNGLETTQLRKIAAKKKVRSYNSPR